MPPGKPIILYNCGQTQSSLIQLCNISPESAIHHSHVFLVNFQYSRWVSYKAQPSPIPPSHLPPDIDVKKRDPIVSVYDQQCESKGPRRSRDCRREPGDLGWWGDMGCSVDQEQFSSGKSLVVQWLGLHASAAGDTGSNPGQGTKIPHALRCSQ